MIMYDVRCCWCCCHTQPPTHTHVQPTHPTTHTNIHHTMGLRTAAPLISCIVNPTPPASPTTCSPRIHTPAQHRAARPAAASLYHTLVGRCMRMWWEGGRHPMWIRRRVPGHTTRRASVGGVGAMVLNASGACGSGSVLRVGCV